MTTRVSLDTTFIHFVHAIWQAANIRKRGLLAERWLRKRLPAITTLECNFKVLRLCAVHADMVRVLLAACAEVVSAAGTPDTVSCHMFCRLACHTFACFVLRRIIWLRRIEREDFITVRALYDVIGIGHHYLRLLFAYILKPLLTESLAQVLCLYHGVALTAAALREVAGW